MTKNTDLVLALLDLVNASRADPSVIAKIAGLWEGTTDPQDRRYISNALVQAHKQATAARWNQPSWKGNHGPVRRLR